MVRMEATAEASLAAIRARKRLGMAIAAMMRMMATTISNSISENPRFLFTDPPKAEFQVRMSATDNGTICRIAWNTRIGAVLTQIPWEAQFGAPTEPAKC